jgi:hypothetical protein
LTVPFVRYRRIRSAVTATAVAVLVAAVVVLSDLPPAGESGQTGQAGVSNGSSGAGPGPAASTSPAVSRPGGPTTTAARVGTGAVAADLVWERDFRGVTFRESSPLSVDLGHPAVVVGGHDGRLYALALADGHDLAGWPVRTPYPFNGSAAAADVVDSGTPQVFVGAGFGDKGECSGGGVYSFESSGKLRWQQHGTDPSCASEAFHSSPAIGDITGQGVPDVTLGALGLHSWSFSAPTGALNAGWPYYTDDTVYSSPALADVNGDGVPEVIMGGDSSPGGLIDLRGGIVRAVTGSGRTVWQFTTDEIVRSSPAVGDIDGSGRPSVVFGTGNYWATHGGSKDSHKVFALDLHGRLRWSRDLGAITMSSPALADVAGTGHADVVIGTAGGPRAGRVWVLDNKGRPLPHWDGRPSGGGVVIGGITTADLNGDGAQDLLVPTGAGVFVYDGRTAGRLFSLDEGTVSFQSSPLVTDDGSGVIGITVAGTRPDGTGVVQHWQMASLSGARLGKLGWPTFHHDSRRTGNEVPPPLTVQRCPLAGNGYWTAAGDGGVFSFCGTGFDGSATNLRPKARIMAIASTPDGTGYWEVGADGGVFAFGTAPYLGSASGLHLASPVVAITRTATGRGYWLTTAAGGVYTFGDALFAGSLGTASLRDRVVSMTATPSGHGYWLGTAAGAVYCFGDAGFFGTALAPRHAPITSIARTPSGNGYWLAAADGGIFTYGDAKFLGSAAGLHLNGAVVGIVPTAAGRGYWLAAADGGVFAFGDARFVPTTHKVALVQPIVAIASPGS